MESNVQVLFGATVGWRRLTVGVDASLAKGLVEYLATVGSAPSGLFPVIIERSCWSVGLARSSGARVGLVWVGTRVSGSYCSTGKRLGSVEKVCSCCSLRFSTMLPLKLTIWYSQRCANECPTLYCILMVGYSPE